MTKRKQHKPNFKARVALEAVKGEQTVERDYWNKGFIGSPAGAQGDDPEIRC